MVHAYSLILLTWQVVQFFLVIKCWNIVVINKCQGFNKLNLYWWSCRVDAVTINNHFLLIFIFFILLWIGHSRLRTWEKLSLLNFKIYNGGRGSSLLCKLIVNWSPYGGQDGVCSCHLISWNVKNFEICNLEILFHILLSIKHIRLQLSNKNLYFLILWNPMVWAYLFWFL